MHQQLCWITSCILTIWPLTMLSGYISNGCGTFAHLIQLYNFNFSELVNILGLAPFKSALCSLSSVTLIWPNEKECCRKDHFFSFLLRNLENMWITIWWSFWNFYYVVNQILFMMLEKKKVHQESIYAT